MLSQKELYGTTRGTPSTRHPSYLSHLGTGSDRTGVVCADATAFVVHPAGREIIARDNHQHYQVNAAVSGSPMIISRTPVWPSERRWRQSGICLIVARRAVTLKWTRLLEAVMNLFHQSCFCPLFTMSSKRKSAALPSQRCCLRRPWIQPHLQGSGPLPAKHSGSPPGQQIGRKQLRSYSRGRPRKN